MTSLDRQTGSDLRRVERAPEWLDGSEEGMQMLIAEAKDFLSRKAKRHQELRAAVMPVQGGDEP